MSGNQKRKQKQKANKIRTDNQHETDESLPTTSSIKSLEEIFPCENGKHPNYGTNDTLELLEKIPGELVDMKLDEVLVAVKTVDNLCDFKSCKTATSLMGLDCCHCKKRFCFKHGLPEVHGCGEAIKKDERQKFLHPKPAKTVRQEVDLAKAKVKLQTKLKDMQVCRMQKNVGGKDKKSK